MTVDLQLIRHALALAKHGNFRRAAQALHVSQPTLSRNIAALESSLGVRLFDRTRAGVEPTAFGRLVMERGKDLLAGAADLRREIGLRAGLGAGSLSVSADPHAIENSVAHTLGRLISEHPGLRLQATVTHARDSLRDVLSGEVDVSVTDVSVTAKHERLLVQPLPTHQIYLACRPGHPLANRRELTAAEIDAYPLAATNVIGHIADFVKSTGVKGGTFNPVTGDYRPAIHVNSYAVARQIACGSDAIASGIAVALASDLEAGRLVMLDFHHAEMHTRSAIVTLKGRSLSPPAAKFIALLREVEAEVVEAESRSPAPWTPRSKALRKGRRHRP